MASISSPASLTLGTLSRSAGEGIIPHFPAFAATAAMIVSLFRKNTWNWI